MYLEQELTKEQIVELYLNVVEFGPNLYGIGPAARTYFSTPPADLTIGQSLYLTSILPNPKVQHFGAGNAVTPAYLERLHKLMEIANKRGHLSDEELEEGLREILLRGSASPRRGPSDIQVRSGNEEIAPPEESGEWLAP
jgi:membrane peptidoglycan carboxypeptidase